MKKLKYLLVFCNFIILIIVLEIGLSLFWNNYWLYHNRYIKLREQIPISKRRFTRDNISRSTKDFPAGEVELRVNKQGFMLPDRFFNTKNNDSIVIAYLGDSRSAGAWHLTEKRLPNALAQLICDSLGLNVILLNASITGGNTSSSVNTYFNKIRVNNPDFVIVFHFLRSSENQRYLQLNHTKHQIEIFFDFLSQKSNIIGFLRHLNAQIKIQKEQEVQMIENINRYDKQGFEREISVNKKSIQVFQILLSMINQTDAKPIVLQQPIFNNNNYEIISQNNQLLSQISQKHNAKVIHWDSVFSEKDTYDGTHFTEQGLEKATMYLFNKIRSCLRTNHLEKDVQKNNNN